MRLARFATNPIIRPHMDARMGDNINGPSLIRVPDWVKAPLGRYYLYFAHHDGRYIRLAFADDLAGPWTMHEPGVLPLAQSTFAGHIASPDVHIDDAERRIRMYFHGADAPSGAKDSPQFTRVALSSDGLNFSAMPENLGKSYFRVFAWRDDVYALGMPGDIYRSKDGLTNFEMGPTLFTPQMRHAALKLDGHTLSVFYTNVGDAPESILLSRIDLTPDWRAWQATPPVTVLQPELAYEGADQPRKPSVRGLVHGPVCQLRDPAIYREDGRTYLLYSVAGEHGIAIGEIT
ncbi:MAG: hypothetical protein ACKVP7_24160 [Hyphomicrobiaceae bacterium]